MEINKMFNVGQKVRLLGGFPKGADVGYVEEILDTAEGTLYLTNIPGYSNTSAAKAVNRLMGWDHGYVPCLAADLVSLENWRDEMFSPKDRVKVVSTDFEDVPLGSVGTVSATHDDGFIMVLIDGFVPTTFDLFMAALTDEEPGVLPFVATELELI
jgi:hypothetical protein